MTSLSNLIAFLYRAEAEREEWANAMSSAIAANQSSVVDNPLLWKADSSADACTLCFTKFTIFHRKHHCRKCGAVVCQQCSMHKRFLKHVDAHRDVRICDDCFAADVTHAMTTTDSNEDLTRVSFDSTTEMESLNTGSNCCSSLSRKRPSRTTPRDSQGGTDPSSDYPNNEEDSDDEDEWAAHHSASCFSFLFGNCFPPEHKKRYSDGSTNSSASSCNNEDLRLLPEPSESNNHEA